MHPQKFMKTRAGWILTLVGAYLGLALIMTYPLALHLSSYAAGGVPGWRRIRLGYLVDEILPASISGKTRLMAITCSTRQASIWHLPASPRPWAC